MTKHLQSYIVFANILFILWNNTHGIGLHRVHQLSVFDTSLKVTLLPILLPNPEIKQPPRSSCMEANNLKELICKLMMNENSFGKSLRRSLVLLGIHTFSTRLLNICSVTEKEGDESRRCRYS